MKLEETKVQKVGTHEMRYQVTLSTNVSGTEMYWRTRVTATSPQHALIMAQGFFKKYRGRFREAMLRKWGVSDVTPLARKEQ